MKDSGMIVATLSTALATCVSSAHAEITIQKAEIRNGVAFVKGIGAELRAQITWEGNTVARANRTTVGFSFYAVAPADCVGALSDGVRTGNVTLAGCTPGLAGVVPVPRTGQTTSYATGDDGALQKGVVGPSPRFTDNADGTITDNLTSLVWLKDSDCFGLQNWFEALADALSLNSGECGLTDGSVAGDW